MIQILLVIFVVAVLLFIWQKNKQYNRSVDRHNRMVEKQEELLQLLKDKKNDNEQDTDNTPSGNGDN
jgi:nitrogen fixation-related uncharacterized protein